MNSRTLIAFFVNLVIAAPVFAEDAGHGKPGGDASGIIKLTAEEQRAAGVVVDRVSRRALGETIRVPGNVEINMYRSARVTPRITAQVVARHVILGESVSAGQRMVTLSSVAMAEAQAELIIANREWERSRSLGPESVSERRYTEARVARQLALARVLAYGMTEAQADALMSTSEAERASGVFDLLSPQAGTVLQDNFIVGELIEPGRVLFDISDESVMWVEARPIAVGVPDIHTGMPARVTPDGVNWIDGTVVQRYHRVDETTRTHGVRIEVDNADDQLHERQFVEVEIVTGKGDTVLAVPSAAVTMIGDTPTVFKVEHGHEFHAESVASGPTVGDWTAVSAGLREGDVIVVAGIFHLKSLMLKSSLGGGHAH
ncbi:MAG: efflux RND transporter periplasmic adaptor subunit [Gemmatimonadota bacterium]|nr:efflux RND transporter periplasmic adaptor subunit [Gemmatimonadota bacterium]